MKESLLECWKIKHDAWLSSKSSESEIEHEKQKEKFWSKTGMK